MITKQLILENIRTGDIKNAFINLSAVAESLSLTDKFSKQLNDDLIALSCMFIRQLESKDNQRLIVENRIIVSLIDICNKISDDKFTQISLEKIELSRHKYEFLIKTYREYARSSDRIDECEKCSFPIKRSELKWEVLAISIAFIFLFAVMLLAFNKTNSILWTTAITTIMTVTIAFLYRFESGCMGFFGWLGIQIIVIYYWSNSILMGLGMSFLLYLSFSFLLLIISIIIGRNFTKYAFKPSKCLNCGHINYFSMITNR